MKSLARIALIILALNTAAFAGNDFKLYLKSGTVETVSNMNELQMVGLGDPFELVNGNYYRIIQFNALPTTVEKEALANEGIQLLNYLPKNAYYAQINSAASIQVLKNFNVRAVLKVTSQFKLSEKLLANK